MFDPYASREHPKRPDSRADELVEGCGPYWLLSVVQKALIEGRLDWELTSSAEEQLLELMWDDEDLDGFIQSLHSACCKTTASQWCLEPKVDCLSEPDDRIHRLADVYVMGYQRFRKVEQPRAHPKIYFKFTITESPITMLIYSIHLEREFNQLNHRRNS